MRYLILCLFLVGCSQRILEPEIVTKTKVITPPNNLLRVYKIPKPIDKKEYLKLTQKEKEKILTLYIIDLLRVSGKYKYQTLTLRNWKRKIHSKSKD